MWKPALRITAKRFKSLQATELHARHVFTRLPFLPVFYGLLPSGAVFSGHLLDHLEKLRLEELRL